MNLYDWSQAPDWAQYAATDSDGIAYWHEHYPEIGEHEWCAAHPTGKVETIGRVWQDSLEKRPDDAVKAGEPSVTRGDLYRVMRAVVDSRRGNMNLAYELLDEYREGE